MVDITTGTCSKYIRTGSSLGFPTYKSYSGGSIISNNLKWITWTFVIEIFEFSLSLVILPPGIIPFLGPEVV